MIEYNSNNDYALTEQNKYTEWLKNVIEKEGFSLGEICYVFTSDEELWQINLEYLGHDYYTDIITFDYTEDQVLSGDIFISTDRVEENAGEFGVQFEEELRRIMVHGILHLMGYRDKTKEEKKLMRLQEESKLKLFHVEQ